MKKRLRRNSFRIDVEGEAEDIQRLTEEVNRLDGVEAKLCGGESLKVQFADGVDRAAAVTSVLQLVQAGPLVLQAVHSAQNETEDIYLQLLQEDEAHGFQRFRLE